MRILPLFTVFLFPSLAGAQTFGGIGTRAEGMGGAFVAVADDATAVYWNPAGMATGATFDFQVTRAESQPGSTLFIGATLPVLGLSFYRAHTVQAVPDRQNGGSGKVEIRTLTTSNTGITVVQSVVPTVVIGSTARLVRGGVDSSAVRTTVDFDAGAMWVPGGGFRAGITGRNLREPEFEADSGPFSMQRQVRAGVSFAPRAPATGAHGPFSLAFDSDLSSVDGPEGDVRMAAFGAEYWLFAGRLGGRAGIRWASAGDAERAVSGGLTVKLPRSAFVEGHMTKPEDRDVDWSVGARVTF